MECGAQINNVCGISVPCPQSHIQLSWTHHVSHSQGSTGPLFGFLALASFCYFPYQILATPVEEAHLTIRLSVNLKYRRPVAHALGMSIPFTTSILNRTLSLRVLSRHGFWHKKFSFPNPNVTQTLQISIDAAKSIQVHSFGVFC